MTLDDEHSASGTDNTSSTESVSPRNAASFFEERPPQELEVAPQLLRHWSRRDLLLFGMGAMAAVAVGASLLPQTTLERLTPISCRSICRRLVIHKPARDSPQRKTSLRRARSSAAAGCTCETRPGRTSRRLRGLRMPRANRRTTGRSAGIRATTEFESSP